jgi:hypothetical protein
MLGMCLLLLHDLRPNEQKAILANFQDGISISSDAAWVAFRV